MKVKEGKVRKMGEEEVEIGRENDVKGEEGKGSKRK